MCMLVVGKPDLGLSWMFLAAVLEGIHKSLAGHGRKANIYSPYDTSEPHKARTGV